MALTRDEMIELVQQIMDANDSDRVRSRKVELVMKNVAHPFVTDVLRSDDFATVEDRVDELMSWKAQALPPPSG